MDRAFPLLYGGYRTHQISLSAVYREDWQGRVRLSSLPRKNLLYPSDGSSRWGFFAANRVSTSAGLLDPAGGHTARRITCTQSGGDVGPHYPGRSSALTPGQVYTFSIALRGVQGGESVRIGIDGGSVSPVRATLTSEWQLLTYTAPYREGDVYTLRLILPDEGESIEYAFAGLYLPEHVGAVIPTTTGVAEAVDYQLQTPTTVVLPAPLSKQAHLYWDGHIYWSAHPSLLPPNALTLEQTVASIAGRVTDIPVELTDLWDPRKCPERLLPWLAWGLSVDTWSPDWPLHIRRSRVASAIPIQQIKGTAQSVRDVVESFGGNVEIVEWWQVDPPAPPYTFKLTVTLSGQGDSGGSSRFVEEVIAEVNRTKPVRSHFTFIQGVEFFGRVGTKAMLRPAVLARLSFETLSWP